MKKKKIIIYAVVIAAAIISGYFYFRKGKAPDYDFITAQKMDLIREVSVTGRVKAAESVNLAFENSGKVFRVYADVGDKVAEGQILASQNNTELAAQLAQGQAAVESEKAKLLQYEAGLEVEEAKLAELKLGTRPEEIKVYEVKVKNAKTSLEDAKNNLIDKLQDAYTKSDDAVRNKADHIFSNPRSDNPQIKFQLSNLQLKTDVEWERFIIEGALNVWKSSLDILTASSGLGFYTSAAKKNLNQTKSLLDKSALAVNSAMADSNISQTTIDGWKSDISTGRTNVNAAITNLSTAEEKLKTAESDLSLAEQELSLKQAGTIAEQISAQEAKVKQAEADIASQNAKIKQSEADVQKYQAQIAKTILRSPINGIVTKQDAKVGEIIAANTAVASIISEANFEIKANVPEADIAKIKIGNIAKLTLDPYGSDVIFEAKVIAVDPAETIIDGVATYKTTLQFITEDGRVKSGMTANIDISTETRANIIAVSQRAVITKNGDKILRILDGENIKEIKVKTGLLGSDGNIEITEGVKEGDKVIIFLKE